MVTDSLICGTSLWETGNIHTHIHSINLSDRLSSSSRERRDGELIYCERMNTSHVLFMNFIVTSALGCKQYLQEISTETEND